MKRTSPYPLSGGKRIIIHESNFDFNDSGCWHRDRFIIGEATSSPIRIYENGETTINDKPIK